MGTPVAHSFSTSTPNAGNEFSGRDSGRDRDRAWCNQTVCQPNPEDRDLQSEEVLRCNGPGDGNH